MSLEALIEYEQQQIGERQALPERYLGVSEDELDARISAARASLGDRLVILGHHYQRDEVFKYADHSGDSYNLARAAAAHTDAEFIVFCGVHFMAESADVLSAPHQRVFLPDLAAGCSMADMAAPDELERCWQELQAMGAADVVPVTYMNSAAAIKAFCGREGGVVCTSSNAEATFSWAWARGEQILFLPDEHLGRNTAYATGVPLEAMAVWDPQQPMGGLTRAQVATARIILWKGHCSVHTRFSVAQIEEVRRTEPGVRVIVHPECTWDVVRAADESGSTGAIIRQVRKSPVGSVWAIGTEIHLVNRLATELAPDRTVLTLDALGCLCSTMFRVSPNHLCWVLESLIAGDTPNQIVVPDEHKDWTRIALDRMLSIQ